jgi:hypothetical protein
MHRVHHDLQCRIDNGTSLFGVEAFNQCSRPFEVSKERGDGLTFTVCAAPRFQRGLLGANPFG